MFLQWFEKRYPYLVYLIFFQLYLKTICPTVYWEDSSEFVTASYSLGITHPTGYPIYCMMGKLTSFLWLGNIAYRVNLVSAICSALGITIFYLLMVKLSRKLLPWSSEVVNHAGIWLATFYTGFLASYWDEGIVAEVYSLNILFFLMILYTGYKLFEDSTSTKFFYLFLFLYGISLSNHMTMGLFLPVFAAYFVYCFLKKGITLPKILLVCTFGLLGLTPYLYIIIRSGPDPMKNWFYLYKLKPFINHLLATHYSGFYTLTDGDFYQKSLDLYGYFQHNYHFPELVLILVGTIFFARKWLKGLVLLVTLFLVNLFFIVYYLYETFFLPSFIIFSILTGAGMIASQVFLARKFRVRKRFCAILMGLIALIILSDRYMENFYNETKHDHYWAKLYGINLIQEIPINGMMLSSSDHHLYLVGYYQKCEKLREDIKQIHRPGITWDGYLEYKLKTLSQTWIPTQVDISRIGRNILTKGNIPEELLYDRIRKSIIRKIVINNLGKVRMFWEGGKDTELLPEILVPAGLEFELVPDPGIRQETYPPELFQAPDLRNDIPSMDAISLVYYNYGVFYIRSNRVEKAIEFFRIARRINSRIQLGNKLGNILGSRKQPLDNLK